MRLERFAALYTRVIRPLQALVTSLNSTRRPTPEV
jgi:hypothetical protein